MKKYLYILLLCSTNIFASDCDYIEDQLRDIESRIAYERNDPKYDENDELLHSLREEQDEIRKELDKCINETKEDKND